MHLESLSSPPLHPPARIQSLDLLRGFALLGMFVVHFHVHSTEPGGLDDAIRTFIWRMVEGKSHATFALLFGAGFALQFRNAEARREAFAARYVRRLAALALFGFAAHACFGFNVLLGYATWGVALLAIRQWSTPALLVTALLSAASVPAYQLATTTYVQFTAGREAAETAAQARRTAAIEVNRAVRDAQTQESYTVLFRARLRHMAWFYTQPFFFLPNVTLALFVIGLLLVRHRVFEAVIDRRRLLLALALFGTISWLGDNWLFDRAGLTGFGILREQWLAFTYVGGAVFLFAIVPALALRLRPVATAGRMALTNYLLQIAALDLLFSGYALGLDAVRPIVALAAALTCFAIEVVLSHVWLARFRFGPAEWAWRTLAYGRVQPMRRTPVGDAVAAGAVH